MKHLETFTKWFSKLNTKHKSAIIKKLEEIYEVEAFPELQMKIVSLEREKESLQSTVNDCNIEITKLHSEISKMKNLLIRYEDEKTFSLIDFNHIWSKLNAHQKEEMKKAVIENHWHKEVQCQKAVLEHQIKLLREANESLLQQLLELKK